MVVVAAVEGSPAQSAGVVGGMDMDACGGGLLPLPHCSGVEVKAKRGSCVGLARKQLQERTVLCTSTGAHCSGIFAVEMAMFFIRRRFCRANEAKDKDPLQLCLHQTTK